eukprot:m.263696 g.263696  ORF g.263696 m.263696 type:complete len:79 (+) comp40458_c0_seq27:316-552(+)
MRVSLSVAIVDMKEEFGWDSETRGEYRPANVRLLGRCLDIFMQALSCPPSTTAISLLKFPGDCLLPVSVPNGCLVWAV